MAYTQSSDHPLTRSLGDTYPLDAVCFLMLEFIWP